MDRQDDDEPAAPSRLTEPVAWIGCLLAAVVPTAMLASIAQSLDRSIWPPFVPLLFILIFTLMVVVIRPWTQR